MKKILEIYKINSLVELFFNQYENQLDKKKLLLSSLIEPRKNFSWQEITKRFIELMRNSKQDI